jgi:hypothetical protein
MKRINAQVVVGLLLTLFSAYYWSTFVHAPDNAVPEIYRYTFRMYPQLHLDIVFTFVSMLLFYRGLKRLRR